MENNKIIATQTPPEWQESPLFFDESAFYNVFLYGNRNYQRRAHGIFEDIDGRIQDIAEEWDSLQAGESAYKSFADILHDLAPKTDGSAYARAERLEWAHVAKEWFTTDKEEKCILDALRLMTGAEYKKSTLCGSHQGDWLHIIYPAEYSAEWLRTFEVEYFDTGTEWSIDEGDGNIYTVYCTTYDPRAEIAETVGTAPENIKLFEFDGWTRTPKYKEVRA